MEIPGYRIQREIGRGGMATVYLAIQESLNRSVVLKILDQVKRNESEDMTQRFLDEGRIIASLHHPNIVTIYDIGLAGDDLYISMEYVEGGDLKQRLLDPMQPETVLDITAKIASALASAHSHNVIHRDVKPANILFRNEMTPLLTDFGIAKQTDHDQDLTSTGIFLGSPNYVSPEQADGRKVDGRSDIYSLGCIFYEMLTGYKPYHSNSVIDIVIKHKSSPVPNLPASLSKYQSLLNRMMAKDLNKRFNTADELVDELEKLQVKSKITGMDITGVGKTPASKKKKMVTLMVLLFLSATFFFGLQFVEIRIKRDAFDIGRASTNTVLQKTAASPNINLAEQTLENIQTSDEDQQINQQTETVTEEPVSDEILQALEWLGNQSLDEYKLTYPPKDNAYYYFSKLLELQPENDNAYKGILSIAERYAILAERSLANNEVDKTKTYIELGLQIDPQNQALQSLQSLIKNNNKGLWATLKSFF